MQGLSWEWATYSVTTTPKWTSLGECICCPPISRVEYMVAILVLLCIAPQIMQVSLSVRSVMCGAGGTVENMREISSIDYFDRSVAA